MLVASACVLISAVCIGWWKQAHKIDRFPTEISNGLSYYGDFNINTTVLGVALVLALIVDQAPKLAYPLFFVVGPCVASPVVTDKGYHGAATLLFLWAAICITWYLGSRWFALYICCMGVFKVAVRIVAVGSVEPAMNHKTPANLWHYLVHLIMTSRAISNRGCGMLDFPPHVLLVHNYLPVIQWITYIALLFAL